MSSFEALRDAAKNVFRLDFRGSFEDVAHEFRGNAARGLARDVGEIFAAIHSSPAR